MAIQCDLSLSVIMLQLGGFNGWLDGGFKHVLISGEKYPYQVDPYFFSNG